VLRTRNKLKAHFEIDLLGVDDTQITAMRRGACGF
jgi:hypothetical protein